MRAELGAGPDDVLVGYVGLHGRFQGLDAIIDAADKLREHKQIRFVFIGAGVEKRRLVSKVQDIGLDNVTFLDAKPKSEMPAIVASCDVSVVSLLKRMPGTMPSKFYEAIASGSIPLTADGCEAATLVRENEAGTIYEPMDGESAAVAISKISEMDQAQRDVLRENGRKLAGRFDRDKLADIVNRTLIALVEGKSIPPIEW